jgi:hypothetical protein
MITLPDLIKNKMVIKINQRSQKELRKKTNLKIFKVSRLPKTKNKTKNQFLSIRVKTLKKVTIILWNILATKRRTTSIKL